MAQYDGIDREAIQSALLTYFKTALAGSGYQTMSRQHVQPPQLTPDLQPGFFLVFPRETRAPKPVGLPVRLTLSGFIILYFRGPEPRAEAIGQETQFGATIANALLKAIDDAMKPDDPSGRFTLGGLVQHCWIEGEVNVDPCIYTAQGAAIIPIRILVP